MITSSPVVSAAMLEEGFPVRCIAHRSLPSDTITAILHRVRQTLGRIEKHPDADAVDRFLLWRIESMMVGWARDVLMIDEEIDRLDAEYDVAALLTMGTSNRLVDVLGRRYQSRGVKWLTYLPMLQRPSIDIVSSTHPVFFRQADAYLVYGSHLEEQLRDLLATACIEVVGSTTFDNALGRDRERDREHVRTAILRHWSGTEKLVVVATECSPRAFEEIDPVVRCLANMHGVHAVIKVHPSDSLETYANYAASLGREDKLEVVKSCDVNALVHAAELLVGVFTNLIVTAAVLGTPTLVCDFSNKRAPLDFVAQGLCLGCFDPGDLDRMLRGLLSSSELRPRAEELLRNNVHRFNGQNDGGSSVRVADACERAAGIASAAANELATAPKRAKADPFAKLARLFRF